MKRRSFLGSLAAGAASLLVIPWRSEAKAPVPALPAYPIASSPNSSPSHDEDRSTSPVVERYPALRLLPMRSCQVILPGERIRVTARPDHCALHPERLIIGNNPQDWVVNDIRVGGKSQLKHEIHGSVFSAFYPVWRLMLPMVQSSMDIDIDVTYIGDSKEGKEFIAGLLARAAT